MTNSDSNKPFQIGTAPWDYDEMRELLKEFSSIYENRPIKNNHGGQLSAQLFYSWFVAKKMQPEIIIESGTYKGQGTWAFEQAAPNAHIICLDPFPKEEYKSSKAQYVRNDFTQLDWGPLPKDNCLVFFDDHQNAVARVVACKTLGFKHLMFEDNYPHDQGDCLSLKKVFSSKENYQVIPEVSAAEWLPKVIETYYEMPPIFDLPSNRWGLPWETYKSNPPLLSERTEDFHDTYYREMDQYTWINYVELK